ncbi:NirD/YgiW/YdeI family stress tolerance protein [Paramixta manurensis]|uniref:NirD/YgiW/YdeI family stress tolerance protein n=1 Tax=Paramixta manurensis TaxID=2740817 RepID=A0A6M8U3G3_9GAMM|nr:NirD/YgiW/YdeI family stress tolerance protein [Erwiniaceae bacterium PD-1]
MMKKHGFALALALFALPVLADDQGGFKQQGTPPPAKEQQKGYRGVTDVQNAMTVAKLPGLSTGTWVSLKGNIIRQTNSDDYQLRDTTGTVLLQIDDQVWQGQEVKPDDLVTLNGTLIKHGNSRMVQVKQLRRL